MSIGTLADIRTKFRKLTGAGNPFQLTDDQIDDYINSFYSYDFPAQFRSLKLKDRYVFNTVQGLDTYAFDSGAYTTVQAPCYVAKTATQLFEDPGSFYVGWLNQQQRETFTTGNGTTGGYSGSTNNTPLLASQNTSPTTNPNKIGIVQNVLITANTSVSTMNVYDVPNSPWNGTGVLRGDCTAGTINYQTGAISGLFFTGLIPSGNDITIEYIPLALAQPQAILFFQNQFVLRPVPDQGYTVELIAYRKPVQAIGSATYYPELEEWWEVLAVGAAKKAFEDRGDPAGIAFCDKTLQERYAVVETRTYAQLGKQRAGTIYASQLEQNYNGGWGFGGSS